MRSLSAVVELCTGCGICEMVCSLGHTGSVNPASSRIRVAETEDERRYPVICRHCTDPRCAAACPAPGAMRVDERTGAVVVDPKLCDRCHACVEACPFEALFVGPGGEALKCDLCGGEPRCAKYCFPRPGGQFPHLPEAEESCLRYEPGARGGRHG